MKTKHNNKISPIWNIIEKDNVVELRELVSKGAFINIERQSGIKPIHHAAKKGAIECLKYIIEEGKISVGELDKHGHQPLHHAAYEGRLNTCKFLVEHGADLKANDCFNKQTPLHMAASSGYVDIVRLLLTSANSTGTKIVDMQDIVMNTPLYVSFVEKQIEVAYCLLENGASVDINNSENLTALSVAQAMGFMDMNNKVAISPKSYSSENGNDGAAYCLEDRDVSDAGIVGIAPELDGICN